jgi:hypothetical protein
MATRSLTDAPSPLRLRQALADLLNAVDARDDQRLVDAAEALTARLGVAGGPIGVTAQRELSTREVAGLIDALRAMGVTA